MSDKIYGLGLDLGKKGFNHRRILRHIPRKVYEINVAEGVKDIQDGNKVKDTFLVN